MSPTIHRKPAHPLTMPRKHNPKHVTKDQRMLNAIVPVKAHEFENVEYAVIKFDVPMSTLYYHFQGCPSHQESRGAQQKLTPAQEMELVRWITQLSITEYLPRHDMVQEM